MSVLTEERIQNDLNVAPPQPPMWNNGGNGGERLESGSAFPVSKGRIGLWILLSGIFMLFGGFSSSYIVLRGVPAWENVAIPSILWGTTVILLASSVTIELTRRSISKGHKSAAKKWILATGGLGLSFLAGQMFAWQQMVNAGIYLPSTLHSSFLYILTGAHGLHLLGGIGGLTYVLTQTLRNRYTPTNHEPVSLCATYWHFMDGLWVYLFLMFILA